MSDQLDVLLLAAGKDATCFLMVVERPENNLTLSLMELIANPLRPVVKKSGDFFLLSVSFFTLSLVWTLREAEGGEGSTLTLFGSFSNSMWMGQGLNEVLCEVIRLRGKKYLM